MPHETAAVSAQVLCTPYNHAPCHFMQSHIRKVYACLDVTCHLHFCQNDRDLLPATAVTRGWNGYRNKSQHRNSKVSRDSKPRPFNHESGALTTELSRSHRQTDVQSTCLIIVPITACSSLAGYTWGKTYNGLIKTKLVIKTLCAQRVLTRACSSVIPTHQLN